MEVTILNSKLNRFTTILASSAATKYHALYSKPRETSLESERRLFYCCRSSGVTAQPRSFSRVSLRARSSLSKRRKRGVFIAEFVEISDAQNEITSKIRLHAETSEIQKKPIPTANLGSQTCSSNENHADCFIPSSHEETSQRFLADCRQLRLWTIAH